MAVGCAVSWNCIARRQSVLQQGAAGKVYCNRGIVLQLRCAVGWAIVLQYTKVYCDRHSALFQSLFGHCS